MNIKQLSLKTGVPPETLYRWVKKERLPFELDEDNHIFFRPAAIEMVSRIRRRAKRRKADWLAYKKVP